MAPESASSAFISYSRQDSEFALRLAKDLKEAGASVWLDQLDIAPGTSWDSSIEDALHTASQMLVILSPTSVKSENVRDEISYALRQGRIVVPVLYKECPLPLRLERKQHIDFRSDYACGLKQMLDHLQGARLGPRELRTNAGTAPKIELLSSTTSGSTEELTQLRNLEDQKAQPESQRQRQRTKVVRIKQRERETPRKSALNKSQSSRPLQEAEALRAKETEQHEELIRRHGREEVARVQGAEPHLGVAALAPPPPLAEQTSKIPVVFRSVPSLDYVTETGAYSIFPGPGVDRSKGTSHTTSRVPPHAIGAKAARAAINVGIAFLILGVIGGIWGLLPQPGRVSEKSLQASCDTGGAVSCELLGRYFFTGFADLGIGRDPAKAVTLWQKACGIGKEGLFGCVELGKLYSSGISVPKDMRQAISLWQKGCDGNEHTGWGCEYLGTAYETGNGIDQDLSLAEQAFQKSCVQGKNQKACEELKNLELR